MVVFYCIAILLAFLPTSANAAADERDAVSVKGLVLDPAGKPAAGARLQAVAWPFKKALAETRADEDGTFTITFKKSQFASTWNSWEGTVIVATSSGFAPAWARQDHVDAGGGLVLTLAPDDMPIEGRIISLEGQPVVGAKITLTNLQPKAVDLKDLGVNRSPPPEEYGNEGTPNLPGFAAGINPTEVADQDGRFRMTGLGRNRTASLHVEGPGISNGWLDVLTKDVPQQTRTFQYQPFAATGIQYGAKFEFTASPGRVVTGTVRDAATGKPLAGVRISDSTVDSQPVTDAQGHYQAQGVPKRKDVKFTAIPTDDQPYFMCEANVPDAPGMAPVTVDFNLHRGVWITGKVTDKVTGKPIGAARIYYLPYLTNKNFDNLPEFHFGRRQIPGGQSERYTTDAEGNYRVVALPGPALVTADAIGRAYRTRIDLEQVKCPQRPGQGFFLTYDPGTNGDSNLVKEVNIAVGVDQTTLDMQCDPGATIHLTLVDPDNNPVEGVLAYHHIPGSPYRKLKTSAVDAIAFRPDEKRRLFFFQLDRKLGRIITLGVDDAPNGRLKIRLEPFSNVTGRLLSADGTPMANAAIMGFPYELPIASTDADGRFQMTVIPGAPYNLRGFKDGNEYDTDVKNLTLPPGSSKDLGDVHRRSFN